MGIVGLGSPGKGLCMKYIGIRFVALVTLAWTSVAQAEGPVEEVRFAPPRRIKAGKAFVGQGRMYPSPVVHDVNGDKRLDIVVADVMGNVTVAQRARSKSPIKFAAETPLLGSGRRPLKFSNW